MSSSSLKKPLNLDKPGTFNSNVKNWLCQTNLPFCILCFEPLCVMHRRLSLNHHKLERNVGA